MPPVANPNPDRARRGASTGEAKDEIVPEPLLPVGAPAAAPIVASVAARAPAAAGAVVLNGAGSSSLAEQVAQSAPKHVCAIADRDKRSCSRATSHCEE